MPINDNNKPRRLFLPLGTRMAVPIVLLVAVVALGAYFGLVRTSRVTAMQSKQAAAEMVVKLTARSIMPAVVFADETEMKRVVADLAGSPDVTDVELWGNDPKAAADETVPLVEFHRDGGGAIGRPSEAKADLAIVSDSVKVLEPIISPEGSTVAMLAVRLSTAREVAALDQLSRQILYVSIGSALCFILALLLVLHSLVLAPIQRLQLSAQRLAEGNEEGANELAVSHSRIEDEVVRLGTAFNDMAEAVRDRERRLGVRNTDLKLILDSVEQGFLTALPDGTLLPERSKVVESWLGELPNDCTVWELAGRIDPDAAGWAQMAWLQVVDGLMPVEVALDQLPKRLVNESRHFDLAYHPVNSDGALERMIIVLTDVTADVERQRALAQQHEFSVLVDQFVSDRHAFADFWGEGTRLVERILDADLNHEAAEAVRRDIHTLKGTARSFGLSRLAALCHDLEDSLQGRGEALPTAQELAQLRDAWDSLRRRMDPIIKGAGAFVEISQMEYEDLMSSVKGALPHAHIERKLRELRQEPTSWRLKRAANTLQLLAKRLSKAPFDVSIEHNNLRLPSVQFAQFWGVLPHVLNNAADHGIESDERRVELGKPVPGRIQLATRSVGGELVVEVSDDGAGIDWGAVRELAKVRNLPHATQRDLERVILTDGISSKNSVTQFSGRGVGLAAVATVVQAMGGRIEVESRPNEGTTWRLRIPGTRIQTGDRSESSSSERTRNELEKEERIGRKPEASVG